MSLQYIHIEQQGPSFSFSMLENDLLSDFTDAVKGGVFQGVPDDACIYHLITGRDVVGIGGLSYVCTHQNSYFLDYYR